MPLHKNYNVWMECDGKRLKEYKVETDGNTVSCWVASEIGKTFCVQWSGLHDPLDISCRLIFKVDGIEVDGFIAEEEKEYTMRGIQVDEITVKPLLFSAIALTDDETVTSADYGRSRHDLGIVSVVVEQIIVTGSECDWTPSDVPVLPDSPWNEDEAKAHVHRVAVRSEVELKQNVYSSAFYEPYDEDHPGPVAIFNFKYRPEAFLRAQGIIVPIRLPSEYEPEMSGDTVASVPEPSTSQDAPPHSTSSNRGAPKRRMKSEEQEIDNIGQSLDSEEVDEGAELLTRLEHWQKQQAEIQKQQSTMMATKNVKDTGALVKRLRYWQTQLEEAQKKQAEVVEEMKSSRKSTRKRVKQEHEAADDSGIIEISDDSD